MQVKQAFEDFGDNRTAPEKRSSKRNARQNSEQIKRYPQGNPQPKDPIAQKLSDLFPNGWDWICAPAPEGDDFIDWRTMKDFPLTPVQMWELHQDPDCVIGIRPKDQTRWLIIDIDRPSPYHPLQTPESLNQIRSVLDDIGISRILVNQSSHSGGLHIYCPLPEAVSSFWLSIAVKYALETIDIRLKSGECELFPNPKKYIRPGQGFSNYAAIRLPMQPRSGFIPLDDDLTPLPWSLETWLNQFETLSHQQDMRRLRNAIADGRENFKIRKNRNPKSIASWQAAIAREKAEGWTGPGQTNEKLKTFACDARVFKGLDDLESVADSIYQDAITSPGFYDHSNHVQDIRKRSYEVATWAMKYYWPYGSDPQRSTAYHASSESKLIDFSYHQSLKATSQRKIQEAIARLRASNQLSPGATERANQLIREAKVSRKTLYKKHNLELWHPNFTDPTSKTPETQTEQESLPLPPETKNHPSPKPPEPLLNKESFQFSNNEGFEDPFTPDGATVALPPQGQRAAKVASHPSVEPESCSKTFPITNWDELKSSLPPRLQRKITAKQRQLDLELRRASQEDIPLSQASSRLPTSRSQSPSVTVGLSQREPTRSERREFEEWYRLAESFQLVSDYDWQFREYFVLFRDDWVPYSQLSAEFTINWLKKALKE